MSKWLAAVAVVVVATGCNFGTAAQTCTGNEQCQSAATPGGRCEPGVGLCSFPDTNCDSGWRFGGLAGGQSEQCTSGPGQPGPVHDAAIDARPDAPPDALFCYGTGVVKICLATPPTASFTTVVPTTINTTNASQCASVVSGGEGYCVIAATTITVGGVLTATGSKPLVLLASQSIMTTATIDVASHRGASETIGAGADSPQCDAGTPPSSNGGGGGAGGSFTGSGGPGGATFIGGSTGGAAGAAVAEVTALRGGCPGQDGEGVNKGVRGHGGGAVFLIAGTSITIGGAILAAGEGGAGGVASISGGGGGGSGGMIGFDAPTINVSRLLLASGGGGGEGSNQNTLSGDPGADPTTRNPAAGGSRLGFAGGDGGIGSTPTAAGAGGGGTAGTASNGSFGAGGGGGGGAGIITAPQAATATFADTSPTVTRTP